MEPCAGFAERFIRRASEKSKGWDSLEVDEGFTTVARAKTPPDSILDRNGTRTGRLGNLGVQPPDRSSLGPQCR
jgi:hypothetical protein